MIEEVYYFHETICDCGFVVHILPVELPFLHFHDVLFSELIDKMTAIRHS
ncbi:unnamed protein product [Amoebophrya sp. A120]|nr:unnamed protein product [Amoebophrya sp. A120]|eukprot:GSA120T00007050001.1